MKAVFVHDLKLAIRTGGGITHSLVFFLIFSLLVSLGTPSHVDLNPVPWAGLLWIGVLFSGLLNLDHIFRHDFEDGTFERMVTAPIPLETVIITKILLHWLTTALPLALAAPLIGFILGTPIETCVWLFMSLSIGTLAISSIGSLGITMSAPLLRSNLLQVVLSLPMCIPTLVFGTIAVPTAELGQREITSLTLLLAISCASVAIIPFASAYVIRAALAD